MRVYIVNPCSGLLLISLFPSTQARWPHQRRQKPTVFQWNEGSYFGNQHFQFHSSVIYPINEAMTKPVYLNRNKYQKATMSCSSCRPIFHTKEPQGFRGRKQFMWIDHNKQCVNLNYDGSWKWNTNSKSSFQWVFLWDVIAVQTFNICYVN